MANLGNVGKNYPVSPGHLGAWYPFTYDKRPTAVTMTGTSDVPLSFVVLTRNSVVNARSRADSGGVWNFYDMDDSGSQFYSIASYTQNGATGEAWTATVVGPVATVTKTFAANRAVATAFT